VFDAEPQKGSHALVAYSFFAPEGRFLALGGSSDLTLFVRSNPNLYSLTNFECIDKAFPD
jgi:hypothetical protein